MKSITRAAFPSDLESVTSGVSLPCVVNVTCVSVCMQGSNALKNSKVEVCVEHMEVSY